MKIIIEGSPIAKSRHKCACTPSRKPFAYDPQIKAEMQSIRAQMLSIWNKAFESENKQIVIEASNLSKAKSFIVSFTFLFPVNKSEALVQKNAKLWGFQSHNIKPDFDNLEKLYADCATGIIWEDDCQITISKSKKSYDENPRTEMEITIKQDLNVHDKVKEVLMTFSPSKLKEFLRDVRAFWAWPQERINELIDASDNEHKEAHLTALTTLLAEFACKYGNELKKIQKCKTLPNIDFNNSCTLIKNNHE